MNTSHAHVKFINEKFVEDSDPVEDLIGTRKQISKFMKELGETDTDGNALAECARHGKTEWVKFLLARGANVHALNDFALRIAATNGRTETVQVLLDDGADVHAVEDYALRWAADKGHTETVKLLLDAGANVHAMDDYALRYAAYNGHTETVQVLLDAGADVHAEKDYALRWAVIKRHTETVQVLLDAGADVHIGGDKPLRYAVANGHTETVKVLKDHIAKEKKVVKESLSEKFVEDSDPVEDLGLGTRGKIINELKALSISKDYVIFKNDTFFLKNNLRHTQIEDFYQLQLKYFPPAKKKILEDINNTPKDIKKIIDEAVKNNVALDEIQELIDAAFKYIGTRRAIYQQFDRRDIGRETQVAKIYLAKLSRTKEKKERDDENNLYVFIGYTKKVPVTINGEQYFKNRLGVEKIIKIDEYNYADLQAIPMMKTRIAAQGYENGAVYMIRVPKDFMDEDSYSDIPDFAYDIFDKYKIKI